MDGIAAVAGGLGRPDGSPTTASSARAMDAPSPAGLTTATDDLGWRAGRLWVTVLAAFWICAGLLVHTLTERVIGNERSNAVQTTLNAADASAEAGVQIVLRTLDAVSALHELGRLVLTAEAGAGGAAEILNYLREFTDARRSGVLQVALVGADGVLTWSSVVDGDTPRIDLSDREHIRVHLDGLREPFVSEPLVGRASGRSSVQVTRPAMDRAGRLAGIVVVSLDPRSFGMGLGSLSSAVSGVAALVRSGRTVLARSSDHDRFVGTSLSPEQAAVFATAASGRGRVVGLDGVERFLAWHAVPGYALSVAFGVDSATIDDQVEAAALTVRVVGFGSLLLVAVASVMALLLSARQRARAAADANRLAHAEVKAVLDAIPGAVYRATIGPDGRSTIGDVNGGMARLVGLGANASSGLVGSGAPSCPDLAKARSALLQQPAEPASHSILEYQVQRPDGSHVWVRDHARVFAALPDGGAEIIGLITDMTAERALKAKAEAAARLATLGEMATGLAHELNQPCAAIAVAADVAAIELGRAGAAAAASAAARLYDIAQQTARMRDVVDHFRMFARGEDGPRRPLKLDEIVSGALTIVRGSLHTAGVSLDVRVPHDLPTVLGSAVALEQVLVNALVNARDAMEDTDPLHRRIELRAGVDAAGRGVVLSVTDSGCGVSETTSERAFEPFFTTKPPGKGTGLGLSIAYGTVKAMGGTIALRPRGGGGAELRITLPVQASKPSEVSAGGERARP